MSEAILTVQYGNTTLVYSVNDPTIEWGGGNFKITATHTTYSMDELDELNEKGITTGPLLYRYDRPKPS